MAKHLGSKGHRPKTCLSCSGHVILSSQEKKKQEMKQHAKEQAEPKFSTQGKKSAWAVTLLRQCRKNPSMLIQTMDMLSQLKKEKEGHLSNRKVCIHTWIKTLSMLIIVIPSLLYAYIHIYISSIFKTISIIIHIYIYVCVSVPEAPPSPVWHFAA